MLFLCTYVVIGNELIPWDIHAQCIIMFGHYSACLSGATMDLGQPTDPPVAMKDGEGVEITYKNGGPCSERGTRRWTVLRIVCDTEVGLSVGAYRICVF